MGEVVPLAGSEAQGQQSIEALEKELLDLLEKNRRGELKGIAFASVDSGDRLETWWAGNCLVSRLVGAAALLMYRLSKAWDEATS